MSILVHLADERETASIKENGIKPGKGGPGVFCMPVLPNFYVSHQWLREIKRRGTRTLVGVYFNLNKKTLVYVGKYNQKHQQMTLGEAIKEIMCIEDPLGYELIIDGKIDAKQIKKIRFLPQNLGWRYFPASHATALTCDCPVCIPSGSINSKKRREQVQRSQKWL